jgi:hypothetical protein
MSKKRELHKIKLFTVLYASFFEQKKSTILTKVQKVICMFYLNSCSRFAKRIKC